MKKPIWPLLDTAPDPYDYTRVWNHAGTELGLRSGGWRHCQQSGCRGVQIGLRWPDRRITWACSEGLAMRPDGDWQIA